MSDTRQFDPSAGGRRGLCCHLGRVVPRQAFTLVELLLVMAVMVMAISLAAPTLANFFRGRTLDAEARQLLALTHHGQSRAVFEGIPMRLWLDVDEKSYGLEEDPGWDERDPKKVEFSMAEDLHLEIIHAVVSKRPMGPTMASGNSGLVSQSLSNAKNLPTIRFLPDGTVEESSPRAVRLFDRDNNSVWLAQTTNHLNYEIRKDFEP